MSKRETLPQRRRSETFEFDAGVPGYPSAHFVATIGFYNDGRVGEIFVHPAKSGSDRDIAVQESAIAVSFALQYGADVESVRSAMPRTTSGRAEGPVGTLLDLLANAQKAEAAE